MPQSVKTKKLPWAERVKRLAAQAEPGGAARAAEEARAKKPESAWRKRRRERQAEKP